MNFKRMEWFIRGLDLKHEDVIYLILVGNFHSSDYIFFSS
jgi:hypothetical protein